MQNNTRTAKKCAHGCGRYIVHLEPKFICDPVKNRIIKKAADSQTYIASYSIDTTI
jgi:hypothetical protein